MQSTKCQRGHLEDDPSCDIIISFAQFSASLVPLYWATVIAVFTLCILQPSLAVSVSVII